MAQPRLMVQPGSFIPLAHPQGAAQVGTPAWPHAAAAGQLSWKSTPLGLVSSLYSQRLTFAQELTTGICSQAPWLVPASEGCGLRASCIHSVNTSQARLRARSGLSWFRRCRRCLAGREGPFGLESSNSATGHSCPPAQRRTMWLPGGPLSPRGSRRCAGDGRDKGALPTPCHCPAWGPQFARQVEGRGGHGDPGTHLAARRLGHLVPRPSTGPQGRERSLGD